MTNTMKPIYDTKEYKTFGRCINAVKKINELWPEMGAEYNIIIDSKTSAETYNIVSKNENTWTKEGVAKILMKKENLESVAEKEGPSEEEDEDKKSVVGERYRNKYGKTQRCADKLSNAISDYVLESNGTKRAVMNYSMLEKLAEQNGVDIDRWAHLNDGMQRMNVSNALRKILKDTGEVFIGEKVLKY